MTAATGRPVRVTGRTDPARRPRHGPYAARGWVAAEGRWRVALTAAGRPLVATYLARYEPAPGAIAYHLLPWLTPARAAARGLTADDVHAAGFEERIG